MSRAIVVGAGLAGLAAGLELKRRGFEVELLERSRLLGGKATSFTVDGVEVDNGQHVHLACCTEFCDFVADVGMGHALHLQERFDVVVLRRGAAPARLRAGRLPAPLHLLASFARYSALSPRAKAEVVWALLAARRPAPPTETASQWLRRHHQGDAAVAAFWEPFIVPALNAPLDVVAAEALLFTVRTAFLGRAGAARIGWSTVPLARIAEAAAARLDGVRRRAPVAALLGGPEAVAGVRLEDGSPVSADAVVLAVPPRRLARILGEPEVWGVCGLDAFAVQPIVDVHLWFGGGRVLDADFAALVGSPVQWVFEKSPGYLVCSLSAAGEVLTRTEAELAELCLAELGDALPALRHARPRRAVAVRDPEATFVPTPGLRRPGPHTRAANCVIAGAWTDTGWPATMESAVRSGRAAARALQVVAGRERAVA